MKSIAYLGTKQVLYSNAKSGLVDLAVSYGWLDKVALLHICESGLCRRF